jgi:hypothetical protein
VKNASIVHPMARRSYRNRCRSKWWKGVVGNLPTFAIKPESFRDYVKREKL